MSPQLGRASTGCGAYQRHKTFSYNFVRELSLRVASRLTIDSLVAVADPQARIALLERELAWAHLKIEALTAELRQQRRRSLTLLLDASE